MINHLTFDDKIGILDPKGINLNPINDKPYSDDYKKLAKIWSGYPAFEKSAEILDSIQNNQLTFIIAGTGAGKTVIVPKLALHYINYEGEIAVTLPKRVVTLSAAMFSAKISDTTLGEEIGYVYKGSDKKMIGSKLTYMTDGYLAAKYDQDTLLSNYKVIIIDEAHERRIQIDLLLLFLKNILASGKRPDLRIIIMSATINGKKYQDYFDGVSSKIVNVSGQPNHEIDVHFLDKPSNSYMIDGIQLVSKIVEKNLEAGKGANSINHAILFFITTSEEALQLCRNIRPKYRTVYCIEVYSDMDKNLKIYAEDRDKYLELGNYNQKVIMATNVAESSLTIDGLKYVIDSGYELYSYFNPAFVGKVLEKRLITKAQALQRRGRVGRTEPGICYCLLTKAQFDSLEAYPTPDILRQDITLDLLKIIRSTDSKTLSEGKELLAKLMDPPKKPYVDLAQQLYQLYNIIDDTNKLTKIGYDIRHFSSISFNRSLFLIYAYQLHCAKEASIILAMLDATNGKISNLFYKADTICKSNCKKSSAKDLMKKMVDKQSDHLSMLKIYEEFKDSSNRDEWGQKYGAKLDLFNKISRDANSYYYKILNISRVPQIARVANLETKRNLIQALKLSHLHLTAKNLTPVFAKDDIEGIITKESVVNQHYNRKELSSKTFIYDEFINISGNWQFNVITII